MMKPYMQIEKGQGLIEYSFTLILIAAVVILAMQFLLPPVQKAMASIGTTLETVSTEVSSKTESSNNAPIVYQPTTFQPESAGFLQVCNGDKFTLTPKLKRCPS